MQSRGAAVIDVDASGDGLDDWARYPPTEIIPPGDAVAFSQFSSGTAARLRKLAVYRRWRDGDHVVERVPDDLVVTVIALGRLLRDFPDRRLGAQGTRADGCSVGHGGLLHSGSPGPGTDGAVHREVGEP